MESVVSAASEPRSRMRSTQSFMLTDLQTLQARLVFFLVFLCLAVVKLLCLCPTLDRVVEAKMKKNNPDFKMDNFTWNGVTIITTYITLDFFKQARQGRPPINVTLRTLEGDTVHLLDRVRPGRPLVVNMGSCS